MEDFVCPKCGKPHKSEAKFCLFCGNDLRLPLKERIDFLPREPQTFFCPKCSQENPVDEIICSNCGEDFGKYNIKKSFADTWASKAARSRDSSSSVFSSSGRNIDTRIVFAIISLFILIAAGVFIWWFVSHVVGS